MRLTCHCLTNDERVLDVMSDTGAGGVMGAAAAGVPGAGAWEGGAADGAVVVPGRASGRGVAAAMPPPASGSDRPMRIAAARERTKGILTK